MRAIIVSVLLLSAFFVEGQSNKFERITIEDGLSQGMIYDLMQDQEGFLWIATKDGLNRYDGYDFKVYTHIPFDSFSISGHEVTALHQDIHGRLWVGTFSNGLNIYDPKSEKFWHLTDKDSSGLSSNTIRDITHDDNGNIWVATAVSADRISIPQGFNLSDYPNVSDITSVFDIYSHSLPSENNVPFSIWSVEATKDRIYLGGETRFFEINPADSYRIKERTHDILGNAGKDFFPLQHIIRFNENQIMVSLNDHLSLLSPDTTIDYALPEKFLEMCPALYSDDNGIIWGGGNTFFKAEQEGRQFTFEYPLGEEPLGGITTVFADRSNIFWMGTKGYGLIKYNPTARIFNHIFSGLNSSVRQIYIDQKNNLWAWKYVSGMQCVDLESGEIYLPKGWPEFLKEGRWILQTKDGVYWFHFPFKESVTEVVAYDPLTNEVQRFPYECMSNALSPMVEGPEGNIWLSCDNGQLLKLDRATGLYQYYDIAQRLGKQFDETQVVTIYPTTDSSLWLGTVHGLIRFYPATDKWKVFRHNSKNPKSISENHILSIHASKKDSNLLWVGTKGGGINRFDKKQEAFTAYNTADGLPNNVVYGILEDQKGFLWLSTNRGLSKFDPIEIKAINYSSFDGLQSNEFNTFAYAQAKNGMLAFGGINGMNFFHPDSLDQTISSHQVVFTEVKVNNEPILPKEYLPSSGGLRLPHDKNLLYFKFSATDYTAPSRNTYRYQMIGVDESPLFVGSQREVAYANLKPGAYMFKVWGSNNSGKWSEPSTISFIISPPWWATSTAYIFYTLLIALFVYLAYRFQVKRLQIRKELEFEHREAERLAELDRMKTNFFSNVTHEFRTPLTLILEPARQLYKKLQDQSQKEMTGMIVSNGQNLLRLVNQLLDLSKIEGGFMKLKLSEGDLVATVHELYQTFVPTAEKKGLQLSFTSTHTSYETTFDKDKLEQCLNNLLSNAVKFTPGGGSISLILDIHSERQVPTVVLTVKDDGQGVAAEHQSRIFDRFFQLESKATTLQRGTGIGLSLVREFAQLMDGSIKVESQEGKGSAFILSFPLTSSARESEQQAWVVEDFAHGAPLETSSYKNDVPSEEALVLVVEDNNDLRAFISNALNQQYKVITASDGAEGWEKAQKHIPDLVVTDLMMPRMNGLELLQRIKDQEVSAHIPVIMLTAKSSIENKISGFKSGADAYLSKPFYTEELQARIEQLIKQRKKLQLLYSQQKGITHKEAGFFSSIDDEFLSKLSTIIDLHLDDETLTIEALAKKLFLSRSQLHRKLKALTNQSASEFIRNYRLDHAMELLKNNSGNVSSIAMMVGIPNQQYFSTRFKKRFGLSPSEVLA